MLGFLPYIQLNNFPNPLQQELSYCSQESVSPLSQPWLLGSPKLSLLGFHKLTIFLPTQTMIWRVVRSFKWLTIDSSQFPANLILVLLPVMDNIQFFVTFSKLFFFYSPKLSSHPYFKPTLQLTLFLKLTPLTLHTEQLTLSAAILLKYLFGNFVYSVQYSDTLVSSSLLQRNQLQSEDNRNRQTETTLRISDAERYNFLLLSFNIQFASKLGYKLTH